MKKEQVLFPRIKEEEEQIKKDIRAMEIIRKRIVACPETEYFKDIFIGFRCGFGPIRSDPADAILAAYNNETDGLEERLKELGIF